MKRHVFASIAVALSFLLQPFMAFAGEYTITPAKSALDPSNPESRFGYYLSADPAQVLESEVTLKNLGKETINVKLIPVDAFHDDKGAFILASPTAKQVGIGSWISIEKDLYTLTAKQSIDVPFKISVPGQIAPGTYFGGLMIGETASAAPLQETGVEVKSFVGVRMFLDVSGEEVIKFNWNKFDHEVEDTASIFKYKFSNDGNVMLKANIDLKVSDLLGNEVFSHQTSADAFPGKETEYSVKWAKRPLVGFFKAKSVVNYAKTDIFGKIDGESNGAELSESTAFYILPTLYLSLIVGLIGFLILFLVWRALSMRNFKKQLKEYKVKKGDTLFELAQKGNVSWKKLAKVNKVKAPYVISSGQTILIPIKSPKK